MDKFCRYLLTEYSIDGIIKLHSLECTLTNTKEETYEDSRTAPGSCLLRRTRKRPTAASHEAISALVPSEFRHMANAWPSGEKAPPVPIPVRGVPGNPKQHPSIRSHVVPEDLQGDVPALGYRDHDAKNKDGKTGSDRYAL